MNPNHVGVRWLAGALVAVGLVVTPVAVNAEQPSASDFEVFIDAASFSAATVTDTIITFDDDANGLPRAIQLDQNVRATTENCHFNYQDPNTNIGGLGGFFTNFIPTEEHPNVLEWAGSGTDAVSLKVPQTRARFSGVYYPIFGLKATNLRGAEVEYVITDSYDTDRVIGFASEFGIVRVEFYAIPSGPNSPISGGMANQGVDDVTYMSSPAVWGAPLIQPDSLGGGWPGSCL